MGLKLQCRASFNLPQLAMHHAPCTIPESCAPTLCSSSELAFSLPPFCLMRISVFRTSFFVFLFLFLFSVFFFCLLFSAPTDTIPMLLVSFPGSVPFLIIFSVYVVVCSVLFAFCSFCAALKYNSQKVSVAFWHCLSACLAEGIYFKLFSES